MRQSGPIELNSQNTHLTNSQANVTQPPAAKIFQQSFDSHASLQNLAQKELADNGKGLRSSIISGQFPENINEIGE